MAQLSTLNPSRLWGYFENITKVPRPSGKEEKIIKFITDFAEKHNLEYSKDNTGNILIRKPASKGYENRKSVCLQSHLDMVCEKNSSSNHDFDKDPIKTLIEGDWVKAEDTTLGADNGVGVATQLAILTDDSIHHGPIECLFTIDEERGLNGAKALVSGFFNSKILINLDSEDEGELFIGCAGGMNTLATIKYNVRRTPENSVAYRIEISGLQGGHSGTDIHKNRGNSVKILNQFLWESRNRFGARLTIFEGGNLRNAIPREAYAIIVIPQTYEDVFKGYFHDYTKVLKREYLIDEPNIKFTMSPAPLPEKVMKKKVMEKLLNALYACPHGVISWSRAMENLVETSTNLASVKFEGINRIVISTSQRSSVNSAKVQIANTVRSTFKLAGALVEQTEGYPGWNPNPDSAILKITKEAYRKIFNVEPEIKAIHAGLECGLFLEKYPYLDMISFGPTIVDPHSPSEKISIRTTEKFWLLLVEVLKDIETE
ncbi:MAG TPA: aminoacyl-histidine dipeptidase [Bacteroidales bacterium]|jgi:dipeptidase D|nr:aminoacyl-histidine dipeptidase [Bacteroidales bacterium]